MIDALRNQQTIRQPATVAGFGYWSGQDVSVEFRPAEADTGIVFVRRDLPHLPRIAATITNRIETPRRTTLTHRGTRVEMIEHILAALAGLRIDNCEVWADGAEMPGCDGSSLAFVEALDAAGIETQDALRPALVIDEATRLGDEDAWIEARESPSGGFSVRFRLDYGGGNGIGRQTLQLPITPQTFREQLAPCRTFLLKAEADWLLAQGLGSRATTRDLIVFDERGPVDNELRFPDECVRHKILDLVGDLSLAGCDLVGRIVAHRSGHRLNAELARALLRENEIIQAWRCSA